jgi:hypothetical protein
VRKHRPSLAELRASIRSGQTFSRAQIIDALDDMHDRLRDEVQRALADAVNSYGGFVQFNGAKAVLVVPWDSVERAARRPFDRRKRRNKK